MVPAPIYIPSIDDTFRMGTFVHLKLPNQDRNTTTIGRIQKIPNGDIAIRLFFPLFPKKNLKCHPSVPSHSQEPVLHGCGSNIIELYQSSDVLTRPDPRFKDFKIMFPAFVFMPSDLSNPKNRWGDGLKNVFLLRFKQTRVNGKLRLVKLHEGEVVCFPTEKENYKALLPNLVAPPHCYHRNVWSGLFQLRKGIMKILNKRSGQNEHLDYDSITLGTIPLETFNYIHMVANSGIESLSCHTFSTSESYLDVDRSLTRRKIKMTFQSGLIRFESWQDIDILRSLLGIGAVYGSSEARPTLGDGKAGRPLKRGHFLTVVKGGEPQDGPPNKLQRRTLKQRVDLSFSPFAVKVTVSFERYHYDSKKDGTIINAPPTEHFKSLLTCTPYANDDVDSDTDESESTDGSIQDSRQGNGMQGSPDTFNKILQMTSSEEDNNGEDNNAEDDNLSLHTHNSTVFFRFEDHDVYQGDQFFMNSNVYEIVALFRPDCCKKRWIILDTRAAEFLTTYKDPSHNSKIDDDELKYVDVIMPSDIPTYACRVAAGPDYNKKKPGTEQKHIIIQHTDEIAEALKAYS